MGTTNSQAEFWYRSGAEYGMSLASFIVIPQTPLILFTQDLPARTGTRCHWHTQSCSGLPKSLHILSRSLSQTPFFDEHHW
jgi:hypothetical protein